MHYENLLGLHLELEKMGYKLKMYVNDYNQKF